MDEQEQARQEKYKADLISKRDKLREKAKAAVAAEQFDQTDAGKFQKDWINLEVNTLVVEILNPKTSLEEVDRKRAQVEILRKFLDNLNTEVATKDNTNVQLKDVNGQLKDLSDLEQRQRTDNS